jgi:hypothetical protein
MRKDEQDNVDVNLMTQIPGIKIGGWTIDETIELRKSKERSFLLQCQNIIDMLRKHKSVMI